MGVRARLQRFFEDRRKGKELRRKLTRLFRLPANASKKEIIRAAERLRDAALALQKIQALEYRLLLARVGLPDTATSAEAIVTIARLARDGAPVVVN